jgi:hypothetical protein
MDDKERGPLAQTWKSETAAPGMAIPPFTKSETKLSPEVDPAFYSDQ